MKTRRKYFTRFRSKNERLFLLLAAFFLTGFFAPLPAQFVRQADLDSLTNSRAAWADADDDGDLDLLLCGLSATGPKSILYLNNGDSTFSAAGAGLPALAGGAIAWGDADNDNDADLLLSGTDATGHPVSAIFLNGGGLFTALPASLPGLQDGSADWADFDNDGDADLLICGRDSTATDVTLIFRNDPAAGPGRGFSDISAGLPGISNGEARWIDFDNDGDADVLLAGSHLTAIYRNDSGHFTDVNAGLPAVDQAAARWSDYDRDGDPDLLLAGVSGGTPIAKIFRNTGGSFSEAFSLTGLSRAAAAWCDYDGDGAPDLALCGDSAGVALTVVYRNTGGAFAETVRLSGVAGGSPTWGDFDRNGSPDLFLTGDSAGAGLSRLYRNDFPPGTAPSPPGGLTALTAGNSVNLFWNKSTALRASSDSLTYNLRIGSTPGGNDGLSPLSESGGRRKLPVTGNSGYTTFRQIGPLPRGTYFWSVQAVNAALNGSAFAPEASFSIANQPPLLNHVLPDMTLSAGGVFTRNLTAAPPVFTDPDGDPLTFSAVSGNPAAVSAGIDPDGVTLRLTAGAFGSAIITLTARDNQGDSTRFNFTVTINQPPLVAAPLPDTTLTTGQPPWMVNLRQVFSDPEGDSLLFTVTSGNPAAVIAAVQDSLLQVAAIGGGSSQLIITATDDFGGSAADTLQVAANRPPVVLNPIPDQTLQPGNILRIYLPNPNQPVFSDPDGDPLAYRDSTSNPTVASSQMLSDTLIVRLLTPGSASIFVFADDGRGGSAVDSFRISPNQPPQVIIPLPDDTLTIGQPPSGLNLTQYFQDPDNDPLQFSAVSDSSGIASASVAGSLLTVTALSAGQATITVTADDGRGGVQSDAFLVSVNTQPLLVNPIPNQTLLPGQTFRRYLTDPLLPVFRDPDGDPLAFSDSSSNSTVATTTISGDTLIVRFLTPGAATIYLTARDGRGGSAADTFLVSQNQPPLLLNPLPDDTVRLGAPSFTTSLASVFSDPDTTDTLIYSATVQFLAVATAQVEKDSLRLFPGNAGITPVYIGADDQRGGLAADTFRLVVNTPPQTTPLFLPDTFATLGRDSLLLNLRPTFSDPDSLDSLTYQAVSALPALVNVSILSDSILRVIPLSAGTAPITVTAWDTRGDSAWQVFIVRVNRAPLVLQPIAQVALTRGGSEWNFNLEQPPAVFLDPDGNSLTYSTVSGDTSLVRAQIVAASLLRLQPGNSTGSTQVTVRAVDPFGADAEFSFPVNVTDGPALVNPLPDTLLTLEVSALLQRNLQSPPVFSPPPGASLTYTAGSSADSVAAVSVTDSFLTVTALAAGFSDISVTAHDGRGGQTTDTFRFWVNRRPLLFSTFPDTVVTVGQPALINLALRFSDPDGDTLHYSATSSDSSRVKAGLLGHILQLNALSFGSADILLSADDNRGGILTETFRVSVNRKPEIIPGRRIPDTTLTIGAQKLFTYNLSDTATQIFSDPDGDALTFSARGKNSQVSAPGLLGTLLTVAPGTIAGTDTITVLADDQHGGLDSTHFTVAVQANRPPEISVQPPDTVVAGSGIVLEAQVSDEVDVGVARVRLIYRSGNQSTFRSVDMFSLGTLYQGAIPATAVGKHGIEFYVEATDAQGAAALWPDSNGYSTAVQMPDGAVVSAPLPGGGEATAYRLFSAPLLLANRTVSAVLFDDLGGYKNTSWRFSEPTANGGFNEYPAVSTIQAGKAYWLLIKEKNRTIDVGQGATFPLTGAYRIQLRSGWNFIGNPFAFDIPPEQIRWQRADTVLNGTAIPLRTYHGEWNSPQQPAPVLRVFGGMALHVDASQIPSVLEIDPAPPTRPVLAKPQSNSPADWVVQILASAGKARDRDNFAGVSPRARDGFDELDWADPPPVGDFVSVRFLHPEWQRSATAFCTDYQAPFSNGADWEFEVRSRAKTKIDLAFAGLESVPSDYQIWLADEKLKISQDLRENPNYIVAGRGADAPWQLKLLIGRKTYIQQQLSGMQLLPQRFEFAQNFPNPFNPSTTIRVGLPRAEKVTLTVFNLLGQRVVTLYEDEPLKAGYHTVVWDGRTSRGRPAGSGIYFYHIRAGNFSATRKMMLLK